MLTRFTQDFILTLLDYINTYKLAKNSKDADKKTKDQLCDALTSKLQNLLKVKDDSTYYKATFDFIIHCGKKGDEVQRKGGTTSKFTELSHFLRHEMLYEIEQLTKKNSQNNSPNTAFKDALTNRIKDQKVSLETKEGLRAKAMGKNKQIAKIAIENYEEQCDQAILELVYLGQTTALGKFKTKELEVLYPKVYAWYWKEPMYEYFTKDSAYGFDKLNTETPLVLQEEFREIYRQKVKLTTKQNQNKVSEEKKKDDETLSTPPDSDSDNENEKKPIVTSTTEPNTENLSSSNSLLSSSSASSSSSSSAPSTVLKLVTNNDTSQIPEDKKTEKKDEKNKETASNNASTLFNSKNNTNNTGNNSTEQPVNNTKKKK